MTNDRTWRRINIRIDVHIFIFRNIQYPHLIYHTRFTLFFFQVHSEFKRQFLEMTVDKLLEQFVLSKYTGLEKPGEFIGKSERNIDVYMWERV